MNASDASVATVWRNGVVWLRTSDDGAQRLISAPKPDLKAIQRWIMREVTEHLPVEIIVKRAARFFGYLIAFMGVMAVIGLVPTVGLFVVVFMRTRTRSRGSS